MGGGRSGEVGAWEAISLVLRIATVGLSLASAIMTAASTQCDCAAGTVSYGGYASFKYSALADLLSAALQGATIWLEVIGKEKWASTVEFIDKLVQALTSSSAALLLAVDDITSCGGGPRGQRQRGGGGQPGGRVRVSSVLSIAAAMSVSGSVYTRHAPVEEEEVEKCEVELINMEKIEEVKTEEKDGKEEGNKEDEVKKDEGCCRGGCTEVISTPPAMPPPWCRCPRLTIPCECEDPELCGAFF